MEDADSDSGFDSDSSRYHAGRDELYGLRTDSHAVGPPTDYTKKRTVPFVHKGGSFCVLRHMGSLPLITLLTPLWI